MITNRQREYINHLPKEIAEKPVEIFHWEEKSLDIAHQLGRITCSCCWWHGHEAKDEFWSIWSYVTLQRYRG